MSKEISLEEMKKQWHGTLKSYLIGFTACVLLTLVSFLLVISGSLSGQPLIYALLGLALIQAAVQVVLFLHVGQEAKPRWESLAFCFMLVLLLIIVVGSLWIMHDLNERMMPEMTQEMHEMHYHD